MESLLEDFQVEHKNPSKRWRRAVAILNNPGLRFRHIAYLAKQNEAERKKQSIQVDISIGEKETSEIQPCSDSPATSPDNYHSCVETEPDDEGALLRSESGSDRNFTSASDQHVSPAHENHDAPPGRDGSKIEVLELIFFLANFIVELMSIVFDQLSSQHKAPFLLLCLIMSILAVLISIFELLYKLIKERATGKRGWRRCLFDPPSGARVGFFPCITALTCAFGQLIINTVNYSLYRKHGNAPIKISIWSTIFAFGQLVSSLSFRGAKTEVIGNQARV
ncbi:hypothetical protein K2173_003970 [Erythroxylum novogranatense]|uniref:Calcium-transporting P-type ATPase N-terminal autoinhibitory domain-containing protein n=1 Tax=Erythroxylum novogranatense TaxID=1862640 RepID=A0AAV8SJT9_9ROSI|nr:hypothetical protein K2173_003970 [Erythroxylum novogranatense]